MHIAAVHSLGVPGLKGGAAPGTRGRKALDWVCKFAPAWRQCIMFQLRVFGI